MPNKRQQNQLKIPKIHIIWYGIESNHITCLEYLSLTFLFIYKDQERPPQC